MKDWRNDNIGNNEGLHRPRHYTKGGKMGQLAVV